MLYGDDEDGLDHGLRIDDSNDEGTPSPKLHENKNGVSEDKKDETLKSKERSPETKNCGLDYLSAGSSTNRVKNNLFMSMDDDNIEEGEIKEPMIKNFFTSTVSQSTPKKRKTQTEMVDASTNVSDLDESEDISAMRQNQYYIRSPTNAGHTFTFTTNYRGQIYHGVLTDGSSPHIHNSQIQKRAAAAEKEKAADDSDEKREVTPKPRGPKRSRVDDEKNSPSKSHKPRHKSPQLHEITKDDLIRCPHPQCGHRFMAVSDVNNHLLNSHVHGRAVVKEEIAIQTDPFECERCVKREQQLKEERSLNELFKNAKAEKTPTKKEKSPVSDDDAAPTLQKEVRGIKHPAKVPKFQTYTEKPGVAVAVAGTPSPSLEAVARESRLPTMPSISQKIDPSNPAASIAAAFPVFPGSIPPGAAAANAIPLFFNQFNPNFANNPIFQQAAAAASGEVPKPQMSFGPPVYSQGNGLSPIPSSSKMPIDPNRHKIHELKTEGPPVVAQIPASTQMPGRSITAGTSGNPMDLLSLRPMPRSVAPPPAAPAPMAPGAPLNLHQMMFGHMFPGNLNQHFNYPSNQPPGLYPPK